MDFNIFYIFGNRNEWLLQTLLRVAQAVDFSSQVKLMLKSTAEINAKINSLLFLTHPVDVSMDLTPRDIVKLTHQEAVPVCQHRTGVEY